MSALASDAAAGNVSQVLGFTNTGSTTCTLRGYPGVAGLNDEGQQMVQATRKPSGMLGGLPHGQTSPPLVVLAPGQTASAAVEGSDVPSGSASSCSYYPTFLVTPPNLRQSVKVSVAKSGRQGFPGCAGLQVNPVVGGL